MPTPSYTTVCQELHATRQHLYDMIRPLSQDELLWVPPRPDGVCVSYHFGHMALGEDRIIAKATQRPLLATPGLCEAFGAHNANNSAARFPSGATIIDYMQRLRESTIGLLALSFRAIRSDEQAVETAEPFRQIINHDYSHTKYIRRICREMGKSEVEVPLSELVAVNESAIAGPQYHIPHW
jgi:hypothetical protein